MMNLERGAAIFAIIMGVAMLGMWIFLLLTGQVSEFETKPIYLVYHLIAEFLTAWSLIIGGFGLFREKSWGGKVLSFSLGMLLYAVLIAGGFYAQQGEVAMISMFTIFTLATIFFLFKILSKNNNFFLK